MNQASRYLITSRPKTTKGKYVNSNLRSASLTNTLTPKLQEIFEESQKALSETNKRIPKQQIHNDNSFFAQSIPESNRQIPDQTVVFNAELQIYSSTIQDQNDEYPLSGYTSSDQQDDFFSYDFD